MSIVNILGFMKILKQHRKDGEERETSKKNWCEKNHRIRAFRFRIRHFLFLLAENRDSSPAASRALFYASFNTIIHSHSLCISSLRALNFTSLFTTSLHPPQNVSSLYPSHLLYRLNPNLPICPQILPLPEHVCVFLSCNFKI